MTSLADTDRKAGWRGRLAWIALALSLTLNLCFIGGMAWVHWHALPPPLVRMQHFGNSLNLADNQRQVFGQFLRTIRLRGRIVRESNQPLIDELWSEIAKPAPDQSAIAKLADQINGNREAFQRAVSTALDAFIETLTPDQRAQLADRATTPHDPLTRRFFQMVVP
ncbi:MAG TPA: periplasmic heavy metal sensor [Stellaceae bacterium]|nr:periplasmic heavy metal sensor [Stellaceae bacterium]